MLVDVVAMQCMKKGKRLRIITTVTNLPRPVNGILHDDIITIMLITNATKSVYKDKNLSCKFRVKQMLSVNFVIWIGKRKQKILTSHIL
jgi:hypothetical protein